MESRRSSLGRQLVTILTGLAFAFIAFVILFWSIETYRRYLPGGYRYRSASSQSRMIVAPDGTVVVGGELSYEGSIVEIQSTGHVISGTTSKGFHFAFDIRSKELILDATAK